MVYLNGTKALYKAPGQIVYKIRVTTNYTTIQYGTNTVSNVAGMYRDEKVIRNLKLNAIFKHLNEKKKRRQTSKLRQFLSQQGNSGSAFDVTNAELEILDFEFFYYDDEVTRKRVLRYDKRTKKEEYWSETRRIKDNKLVGRIKWKEAQIED